MSNPHHIIPRITNQEFLAAIYGSDVPNTYLTSFPGAPDSDDARWKGGPYERFIARCSPQNNNFHSTQLTAPGADGRCDEHWIGAKLVVIDDVGQKVQADAVHRILGEPSYIIETSPGCYQWGYILAERITDRRVHKALLEALKAQCLSDPGATKTGQYFRLPVGINGKLKYRTQYPNGFPVRLDTWEPSRTFLVKNFAASLGVSLDEESLSAVPIHSGRTLGAVDPNNPDIWVQALMELGLAKGFNSVGHLDITCPFVDEHTDGTDDSSAYLGNGYFKCHHKCQERKSPEFQDRLKEMLTDYVKDDPFAPVDTGEGWLASQSFECVDAEDENLDRIAELKAAAANENRVAARASKREQQVCRALAILDAAGAEYFMSTDGRPILALSGGKPGSLYHVLGLPGPVAIRSVLARHGLELGRDALSEITDTLIGRAETSDQTHDVHVRWAHHEGTIYLDLGRPCGQVVEITGLGWRLIPMENCPIRFLRPRGQRPLPLPCPDQKSATYLERVRWDINLPVDLGNVKAAGVQDVGLQASAALLVAIAGMVRPVGAVPHVAFIGPAGSAKTSSARWYKGHLDPHDLDVIAPPRNTQELYVAARLHAVTVLDNLSDMSGGFSDAACRLATNGAFVARKHYSDDDAVGIKLKRQLVLTTILSGAITRADLLDRTVVIQLTPPLKRRTEAELEAQWTANRPALLASLLDALAAGLGQLDQVAATVNPDLLPRLADAALFAEAMARGLGWPNNKLLSVINAAREAAQADQLSDDPIAARLVALVSNGAWEGTATDLLAKFSFLEGPPWTGGRPLTARAVNRVLDRLAGAPAASLGLHIDRVRGGANGNARLIRISSVPERIAA